MPPIVYALIGLWRGMVRMRKPSVITTCFPCRSTLKPAFSGARTACWWLMPGIFGTLRIATFYFTNRGTLEEIVSRGEVFLDGRLYVLESFLFRIPLRPTAGKTWNGNTVPFFVVVKRNLVFHLSSPQPLYPVRLS